MKNVIKRCGVVFILGPIILVLNVAIIVSMMFWGPIYYIITGNDPFVEPLFFFDGVRDWYLEKFGPKDD